MENHTAKHFVLQLGSLISLYLSISFLLVLLFGFINLQFPDPANMWEVESSGNTVRLGIAMVLVFFPTYLVLTRLVNATRRQDSKGNYLGLTKWLIYLSLLVAGVALLADLATVIVTFLNGEITSRFVLKALSVVVVIGMAFYYYIQDARGYWMEKERSSVWFGGVSTVVVVLAVVIGFTAIDAPSNVREQKLDSTQVSDLQEIQWRLQDYLTVNNTLPESLAALSEYSGMRTPTAPENRSAYRYELTEAGFALCATFFAVSTDYDNYYYPKPVMAPAATGDSPEKAPVTIVNPNNWEHGAGEVCFERVVR